MKLLAKQAAQAADLARTPALDIPVPSPTPATWQQGVAIEEYQDWIPAFAGAELERLYGSLYACLPQFRACGILDGAHTYVLRKRGRIATLWLFTLEGSKVCVLNEGMRVQKEELARFAGHIFRAHPQVDVISLHAVICEPEDSSLQFPYPLQRYNCLEDIVLPMAGSVADYRATLGKSTRSYVNRYLNKIRRDHPDFTHQIQTAGEIDPALLEQVFDLNRARMQEQGKVSIIDAHEARRITEVARACGLLSVLLINGKVCAGTIQYRIRDNYFMEVIGHDSAYNAYRLGTLCCYLAICACTERGGQNYHFMWGSNDYKFRLGGVAQALDHLTLYRSRWRLVWNGKEVLHHGLQRQDRRLRLWVQQAGRGEGQVARMVGKLQAWRRHLH